MKKISPCHPNTDEMRSRGSAAALLLYASADGATALPAEYFYAVRVYVTVACPPRAFGAPFGLASTLPGGFDKIDY